MRVNMDSSIASDPRFKMLGKALGVTWREVIGSCFLVWLASYERRSERFSELEADTAAEIDGFAQALCDVGLAHADGAQIVLHGVTQRISFLARQRERGKRGGKRSGTTRRGARASDDENGEANASTKTERREANASRTAQANTPALTLTPAPSLTPSQTPSEEETQAAASRPGDMELPACLNTDEFRRAWEAWEAHRREKRQKLTPTSVSRQLKMLAGMGHDRAIATIEHTITKGWTGLVEPDRLGGKGKPDLMDEITRNGRAFLNGGDS
jgi:hypothetical protein